MLFLWGSLLRIFSTVGKPIADLTFPSLTSEFQRGHIAHPLIQLLQILCTESNPRYHAFRTGIDKFADKAARRPSLNVQKSNLRLILNNGSEPAPNVNHHAWDAPKLPASILMGTRKQL